MYRGLGASITPAKSSGGLFPKITFDESSNLKNLPLETPRTRQVSNLDDYLLNWLEAYLIFCKPGLGKHLPIEAGLASPPYYDMILHISLNEFTMVLADGY